MLLAEFRVHFLNSVGGSGQNFLFRFSRIASSKPVEFSAVRYYSVSPSPLVLGFSCSSGLQIQRRRISEDSGNIQEVVRLRRHKTLLLAQTFSTTSWRGDASDNKNSPPPKTSTKAISKSTETGSGSAVTLSLGEKVKENAKTATYGSVILFGVGVTCVMGYFILSELFSADSPNNIYTKSFQLCRTNEEVRDVLGAPLKCYGEETRKGWRRHVAHQQFLFGDTKILRMKFYIEGKFNKGTVHVEKKGNVDGKYEYSYLLVDVDGYPSKRIVVDT